MILEVEIQTDFRKSLQERNTLILDTYKETKRKHPEASLCRIADAIAKALNVSFTTTYRVIKNGNH